MAIIETHPLDPGYKIRLRECTYAAAWLEREEQRGQTEHWPSSAGGLAGKACRRTETVQACGLVGIALLISGVGVRAHTGAAPQSREMLLSLRGPSPQLPWNLGDWKHTGVVRHILGKLVLLPAHGATKPGKGNRTFVSKVVTVSGDRCSLDILWS